MKVCTLIHHTAAEIFQSGSKRIKRPFSTAGFKPASPQHCPAVNKRDSRQLLCRPPQTRYLRGHHKPVHIASDAKNKQYVHTSWSHPLRLPTGKKTQRTALLVPLCDITSSLQTCRSYLSADLPSACIGSINRIARHRVSDPAGTANERGVVQTWQKSAQMSVNKIKKAWLRGSLFVRPCLLVSHQLPHICVSCSTNNGNETGIFCGIYLILFYIL